MTAQLKNRIAPLLSREQMERYSRQILLEEIGLAGQRRLLESRVLVVGAGGLGSPSSLYLAAAGVGTIGIVDGDRGGPPLTPLFIFAAWENDSRIVRGARNPNCPVCGDAPTIRELIDYDAFCGLPGRHAVAATDGGAGPGSDPAEAHRLG